MVIVFVAVVFKERGIWNRFILQDSLTRDKGFVPVPEKLRSIGASGMSVTPLRPAGTATFDGERIDVVTEGGFIEAQTAVSVVKVEGGRVVVKEAAK